MKLFMCLLFVRYFATEFDWNKNVVTIRQFQAMTKFDKWWLSKCMCIEGNHIHWLLILWFLLALIITIRL